MEPHSEETFRKYIDNNPKIKTGLAMMALGGTVEMVSMALDNGYGVATGFGLIGIGFIKALSMFNVPPSEERHN